VKRVLLAIAGALLIALVLLAGTVAALNFRDEPEIPARQEAFSPTAAQIERG